MNIPELQLYIELINSYYGENYIQSLEDFQEMLIIEFDLSVSIEDIKLNLIALDCPQSRDLLINCKVCGINY